mmetsp:Transcript_2001/g.6648  ORF Transcript_2001/g.6648 Transcript_2001/m.6648 type:complete len:216 (+) Transcript_2001:723-1370(+)
MSGQPSTRRTACGVPAETRATSATRSASFYGYCLECTLPPTCTSRDGTTPLQRARAATSGNPTSTTLRASSTATLSGSRTSTLPLWCYCVPLPARRPTWPPIRIPPDSHWRKTPRRPHWCVGCSTLLSFARASQSSRPSTKGCSSVRSRPRGGPSRSSSSPSSRMCRQSSTASPAKSAGCMQRSRCSASERRSRCCCCRTSLSRPPSRETSSWRL